MGWLIESLLQCRQGRQKIEVLDCLAEFSVYFNGKSKNFLLKKFSKKMAYIRESTELIRCLRAYELKITFKNISYPKTEFMGREPCSETCWRTG